MRAIHLVATAALLLAPAAGAFAAGTSAGGGTTEGKGATAAGSGQDQASPSTNAKTTVSDRPAPRQVPQRPGSQGWGRLPALVGACCAVRPSSDWNDTVGASAVGAGQSGQESPPSTTQYGTNTVVSGASHRWAAPSGDTIPSTRDHGMATYPKCETMPCRPLGRTQYSVRRQSWPPQHGLPASGPLGMR